MIGEKPGFIDSPYFYADLEGWHLKPGAPKEVKDEFDEYMAAYNQAQKAGTE